jgi:hypothetical protein
MSVLARGRAPVLDQSVSFIESVTAAGGRNAP